MDAITTLNVFCGEAEEDFEIVDADAILYAEDGRKFACVIYDCEGHRVTKLKKGVSYHIAIDGMREIK